MLSHGYPDFRLSAQQSVFYGTDILRIKTTTMKERIAEILATYGLTASKFAEILSVQPSGISHILSGRNKPGYDLIVAVLSNFPDISPDWLLLGTGDMRRQVDIAENSAPVSADHAESIPTIPDQGQQPEFPRLFDLHVDQGNHGDVAVPAPERKSSNIPLQENTPVQGSNPNRHMSKNHEYSPEILQVMVFFSDGTVTSYTHKR